MWSILSFVLLVIHVLGTPLGMFPRKRRLPLLPERIFADVEGYSQIRIRQRTYVRSVYELMTDSELNVLSDLFYAEREWNRHPTPEQAVQAREIVNQTVERWLDTEMGRAWRSDNYR